MEEVKKEEEKRPKRKVRRLRNELERTIDRRLKEMGLKKNIIGYRYLIDAVAIVFRNSAKLDALTKTLYPEIAKRNGTTPSRVERAIRHSIDIMWKKGNIEMIGAWFGYTAKHTDKKPTNSETIAILSDRIRREYGKRL